MAKVFISYRTADIEQAKRVKEAFELEGIDAWYAPRNILEGDSFVTEITKAINECKVMVVLLSKAYMKSYNCREEIDFAKKKGKKLFVLHIDNEQLTDEFDFILSEVQMTEAYGLAQKHLKDLIESVCEYLNISKDRRSLSTGTYPISCSDIGMLRITSGDPYYTEGQSENRAAPGKGPTLTTHLTNLEFYLAPPREGLSEEQLAFLDEHQFSQTDIILDTTLEDIAVESGIPDLISRIDESRKIVLDYFLNEDDGCYFNNKKYGVNRISPFGRTENEAEHAKLRIEFYTTDYYTHRVMKDVCKKLSEEFPNFCQKRIKFQQLRPYRILFTSMGVNLLLFDTEDTIPDNTLITTRSTNSTETFDKVQYGVSVIEGVSLSDYDAHSNSVRLSYTALRGLHEELGIDEGMLLLDSLRFYDLFVNLKNLEIGISCSIELKPNYNLEDLVHMKGKDDSLEINEKIIYSIRDLFRFVCENFDCFMPQAAYTIGSYLETMGINALADNSTAIVNEEKAFVLGKRGEDAPCGDAIFMGENYYALIDGNTPKGDRLWDGLPSDAYVAGYLKDQVAKIDKEADDLTAEEMIGRLNDSLRACYKDGEFESLPAEERISASLLICSLKRKELWSFGDCQFRIEGIPYRYEKAIDRVLSNLRSFYIETELISGKTEEELLENDTGREAILPFLKRQMLLANKDCPFGYDLLDGGDIQLSHIHKHAIKSGDHVVMASDGYPVLCETFEESEKKLADAIKNDPLCIHENKGTKAKMDELDSYDDRCFLSFIMK